MSDDRQAQYYCAIDKTPCDGICAKLHRVYDTTILKDGHSKNLMCPALTTRKEMPLPKRVQRVLKRKKRRAKFSRKSEDEDRKPGQDQE